MRSSIIAALAIAAASASAFAAPPLPTPQSAQMPTKAEAAALAAQGARPGDEQMSCEQIGAEMQPYATSIAPMAQSLGGDAQQLRDYSDKRRAEAMAQAPVNIGLGLAASLLPGGGAIAQAQMLAQQAQAERDAAATKPMADKFNADAGAFVAQTAPMQQDPRLQRLMQLSQDKCRNTH
jgi:hypothetical protein